jgi:hypothetical protein
MQPQYILALTLSIPTLLGACGDQSLEADAVSETSELSVGDALRFARGSQLFYNQTFGGNGRVCSTCHLHKSSDYILGQNNFDFTPADAQRLYAQNPQGPLFRPIDSDNGAGNNYSLLLNHAIVRLPFTLPGNITVDERDSLVRTDALTGKVVATVLRSTPTIENIVFEDHLLWDGRLGNDLPGQSTEAVNIHYQPTRLPTAGEQSDLAFFQQQFFSNGTLRRYKKGGPPPVPAAVPDFLMGAQWASVRRGRAFFVDDGQAAVDATHRDLCATCHSGPLLNTTSNSNPTQPPGQRMSDNFAAESNLTFGIGLPEHTYHITAQHDVLMPPGTLLPIPPGVPLFPAGTVFTLRSSDPGRILSSGNPCEQALSCLINSNPALGVFRTTSLFKIPTLWGVADSAPYFHDNSAKTLQDVMRVYGFLFSVTADGLNALGQNGEPFRLSQQDTTDIINYINYGFRRSLL